MDNNLRAKLDMVKEMVKRQRGKGLEIKLDSLKDDFWIGDPDEVKRITDEINDDKESMDGELTLIETIEALAIQLDRIEAAVKRIEHNLTSK